MIGLGGIKPMGRAWSLGPIRGMGFGGVGKEESRGTFAGSSRRNDISLDMQCMQTNRRHHGS